MLKLILSIVVIFIIAAVVVFKNDLTPANISTNLINTLPQSSNSSSPDSSETEIVPVDLPTEKVLNNNYHIFQTFNNCGPAALSMALSYYGIKVSQQELGQALRPYQVPGGNNDDKSVTLEEVANQAKKYDLIPFLRPNGNIELIKKFIANDIPVITRTWLKPNDDIGHYRIVKGYDDSKGILIQDDSLQGKNLKYTYTDFNNLWKKFNYEYLVLVPAEKQQLAEAILADDLDYKTSWEKVVTAAKQQLATDPNDVDTRFNLSVAYHNIGDYQNSVTEYEKIANQLPFRTLWYQIEPIMAYYELGNYERVFAITDQILNNHNRAFSELYLIRGQIYLKQGNKAAAKQQFQQAVQYNLNLESAKTALDSVD